MWNNKLLKTPPTNSYQSSETSVDTENLRASLNQLMNVIKHYKEPIILEKNLLCGILYKYKGRLKKNVEIKFMLKIKKYLDLCYKLDLVRDINNFLRLVPMHTYHKSVYLPTKQMLEYVLVRIQGISKIFNKLINLCKNTAKYMINKMTLGHYWTFALTVLSIVSRIWEISHHIVDEFCVCYKRVIPVHKKLNLSGVKWLSDDYEFPKDLREWLGTTRTLDYLKSLPQRTFDTVTYLISDDEDDDIRFMGSYKNDYIVIDDSIKLNDDVEFVNEYIDLLSTPKCVKKSFLFGQDTVIDIDNLNNSEKEEGINHIQIIDDANTLNNFDNDIGEIINRNDEYVPHIDSDESTTFVTSTPMRLNELTGSLGIRKRKEKIKNKSISDGSPSIKRMSQESGHITIDDDESVISLSDSSQFSGTVEQHKNFINPIKQFKHPNTTIINIDDTTDSVSQISEISISTQDTDVSDCAFNNSDLNDTNIDLNNLARHNLENIKNIKSLKTFLATEKILRSKNHKNCLTKNISKKNWTKIIKHVEKIFVARKQTKQTKKSAMKSAKSYLKQHIRK